ncbi:MAG TPA: M50 family metallopeptidase [Polyangiales bacterium]|nr:M50 family metallopeptidase [Polyangiales bacterium]
MLQVLVAIFGISLLVIVHEAGHYWMARAFGIRVTRFSIGLGPVLAKYQPKGSPTVFQICAIPFLAYVMIAGMNPAEEVDPNDPELYANKSILARMLTIVGGPLANYLAASLMIFALALSGWREDVPTQPMVVASVEKGSAADKAGLKPGDAILEADGKKISNVKELIAVTSPRAGESTTYVVQRDGKALPPMTIVPRNAGGRGVIGVTAKYETRVRQLPVGEATALAFTVPWTLTVSNVEGMVDLIKRRSTEGITGPVGMGKLVAQQAEKGIYPFVGILIAISVALGYFNLLPFPALDGGKLVFLGYEVITRRRPNERIEAAVHAVGLLFLLGVIALVTLRDVVG